MVFRSEMGANGDLAGLELLEFIKGEDLGLSTNIIGAISFAIYFAFCIIFIVLFPLPVGMVISLGIK